MAKTPELAPQQWVDFVKSEINIPAVLEYKNAANGFHVGVN